MRVDSHRLVADRLLGGYRAGGSAVLRRLANGARDVEPTNMLARGAYWARGGFACGLVSGSLAGFLLPPSPTELALVAPGLAGWLTRSVSAWPAGALLARGTEPLWWPLALVGRGKLAEGVDTFAPAHAAGVGRPRGAGSVAAEVFISYGLLGVPQFLLDYGAAHCSAAGWPVAAWACSFGAALLAVALEPARLVCTAFNCAYMAAISAVVGCISAVAVGTTGLFMPAPRQHRRG